LEKKLSLRTPQEVRRILGDPDEVPQAPIGGGVGLFQDDATVDVWIYHNVTRNPGTGKPDAMSFVWFKFGKVTFVACAELQQAIQNVPRSSGLGGLK
jgi:hypothetical protein